MDFIKLAFKFFYNPFTRFVHENWAFLFPKRYVKYLYKKIMGKKLNLDNPKDLNEKIQWLKIYSDITQWTELADKYKVREYVKQCGLESILIKLYGVWDKSEDIDFQMLPEKFVLKTNQAFGRAILVKDKNRLDFNKTKRQFNKWVKSRYGLVSFEPHYWHIERKIIAEELLEDNSTPPASASLIDYKFWCFHGEPYLIMLLYDRANNTVGGTEKVINTSVQACVYDLNWTLRPEVISGSHLNDKPLIIPKPKCFDEMINICRILAKPFPQVRVDLYEVNKKVYFGELTFTSLGGYMDYFTDAYLLKMGEKIDLSKVKQRTSRFIV
jgi:hypothetical protein